MLVILGVRSRKFLKAKAGLTMLSSYLEKPIFDRLMEKKTGNLAVFIVFWLRFSKFLRVGSRNALADMRRGEVHEKSWRAAVMSLPAVRTASDLTKNDK